MKIPINQNIISIWVLVALITQATNTSSSTTALTTSSSPPFALVFQYAKQDSSTASVCSIEFQRVFESVYDIYISELMAKANLTSDTINRIDDKSTFDVVSTSSNNTTTIPAGNSTTNINSTTLEDKEPKTANITSNDIVVTKDIVDKMKLLFDSFINPPDSTTGVVVAGENKKKAEKSMNMMMMTNKKSGVMSRKGRKGQKSKGSKTRRLPQDQQKLILALLNGIVTNTTNTSRLDNITTSVQPTQSPTTTLPNANTTSSSVLDIKNKMKTLFDNIVPTDNLDGDDELSNNKTRSSKKSKKSKKGNSKKSSKNENYCDDDDYIINNSTSNNDDDVTYEDDDENDSTDYTETMSPTPSISSTGSSSKIARKKMMGKMNMNRSYKKKSSKYDDHNPNYRKRDRKLGAVADSISTTSNARDSSTNQNNVEPSGDNVATITLSHGKTVQIKKLFANLSSSENEDDVNGDNGSQSNDSKSMDSDSGLPQLINTTSTYEGQPYNDDNFETAPTTKSSNETNTLFGGLPQANNNSSTMQQHEQNNVTGSGSLSLNSSVFEIKKKMDMIFDSLLSKDNLEMSSEEETNGDLSQLSPSASVLEIKKKMEKIFGSILPNGGDDKNNNDSKHQEENGHEENSREENNEDNNLEEDNKAPSIDDKGKTSNNKNGKSKKKQKGKKKEEDERNSSLQSESEFYDKEGRTDDEKLKTITENEGKGKMGSMKMKMKNSNKGGRRRKRNRQRRILKGSKNTQRHLSFIKSAQPSLAPKPSLEHATNRNSSVSTTPSPRSSFLSVSPSSAVTSTSAPTTAPPLSCYMEIDEATYSVALDNTTIKVIGCQPFVIIDQDDDDEASHNDDNFGYYNKESKRVMAKENRGIVTATAFYNNVLSMISSDVSTLSGTSCQDVLLNMTYTIHPLILLS